LKTKDLEIETKLSLLESLRASHCTPNLSHNISEIQDNEVSET